jgi:hypothetical protein
MSKRFEKIINLMDSAMESEDSWRKTWKAALQSRNKARLHRNQSANDHDLSMAERV